MTAQLVKKSLKSILLMTPFLVMLVMVSALWGIGGKAIYTNDKMVMQAVNFNPNEAKNFLIKGTQNINPSAKPMENEAEVAEEIKVPATVDDPQPEKIKWELVV